MDCGTPATGCGSSTPFRMIRSRPGALGDEHAAVGQERQAPWVGESLGDDGRRGPCAARRCRRPRDRHRAGCGPRRSGVAPPRRRPRWQTEHPHRRGVGRVRGYLMEGSLQTTGQWLREAIRGMGGCAMPIPGGSGVRGGWRVNPTSDRLSTDYDPSDRAAAHACNTECCRWWWREARRAAAACALRATASLAEA